MKPRHTLLAVIALGSLAAVACAPAPDVAERGLVTTPAPSATPELQVPNSATMTQPAETAHRADATLPRMVVHKSASCGCCGQWVDHVRAAGFAVEVRNEDNLNPIKERVGVPLGKGSCHTAEVGGYFVEGHVPAADIKRLLAQRPDAKGLILPGMPIGSPGMEVPDGTMQPYTVELVERDGSTSVFAQH